MGSVNPDPAPASIRQVSMTSAAQRRKKVPPHQH